MSIAGIVLAVLSILGVVLPGMLFTHAVDSAVKAGDKDAAVQPLSGKMHTAVGSAGPEQPGGAAPRDRDQRGRGGEATRAVPRVQVGPPVRSPPEQV